ncbi:RNase HII [Candidatus Xenohaliotis californiensis]|uniref:Ribonuclease HII n=1 Tax=Candidatus Xenohaliotis californiensis TaxID=84677 RepID=A0ABM9N7E7_9RICK|nr:RNase HII [Candidatus Xenohaliotis californiensis]
MAEIDLTKNNLTGTDEVGRGCLAGPVLAAAVSLNPDNIPSGIKDSKKLTAKQRELLYQQINTTALDISIHAVTVAEIEKINILNASKKAMHIACQKLKIKSDKILVDGIHKPKDTNFYYPIPQGDSKILAIAAASIVAKVTRDKLMQKLHNRFPNYGWFYNKGYGTSEHTKAIIKFGITTHHRKNFEPIKSMLKKCIIKNNMQS